MKNAILPSIPLVLLLVLLAHPATALTMVSTFTGTATGTINGSGFTDAAFTIRATSDTNAIFDFGTLVVASSFATIEIDGFPIATFEGDPPVFHNFIPKVVGLVAPEINSDVIDFDCDAPECAAFDFSAAFGPLASSATSQQGDLQTDQGILNVSSYSNVVFQHEILAASHTVREITMRTATSRVADNPPSCYRVNLGILGTGLEPTSVTPGDGVFYSFTQDELEWTFDSNCFGSLSELEMDFPRAGGSYVYSFGGGLDTDTLSYSSQSLPACFPVVTSPVHLGTTSSNATISWTSNCVADCLYLTVEDITDGDDVAELTDCSSLSGNLDVADLVAGHGYRVEAVLANSSTAPESTNMGEDFDFIDAASNQTSVLFAVPEPSQPLMLGSGVALLLGLVRRRNGTTCRRIT